MEIKICGITSEADARAVIAEGVDWIGLNFYRKSPRYVSPEKASDILDKVDGACKSVGLFVNSPREEVEVISGQLGLSAVQLHGDEESSEFEGFSLPLWRAIRMKSGQRDPSPEAWVADRYVVDSRVEGMYGGTGKTADWDDASVLAAECPVMLSGGLVPSNVAEAIARVKPMGIDVASGVESEPGVKDHRLVAEFVAKIRNSSL